MICIKITTDNEEYKKLITSFVFPGISFIDNQRYISFSFDNKHPRYLEVVSKIPDLLSLDTLVEISNSKENNLYLPLPSIDSLLASCLEESKQSFVKESKKRYFEESNDKLEEKEIKKSKINLSHRNRYLKDREIFIDNYLSEIDRLIRTIKIRVGEKYDLYDSLKSKRDFNKDFYLFYSSSCRSKEFLNKLDIYETPMDIISKIIHDKYKGCYTSICTVLSNGYVDAKVERLK
jgi:hypothetical protein